MPPSVGELAEGVGILFEGVLEGGGDDGVGETGGGVGRDGSAFGFATLFGAGGFGGSAFFDGSGFFAGAGFAAFADCFGGDDFFAAFAVATGFAGVFFP